MDTTGNMPDTPTSPVEFPSKDADITKNSDKATNFLENIDPEELNLCLFQDNLVTVSEDGTTVGEFSANVERVTKQGEILLLVHATSQGKIEETPMGTSITTYLNPTNLALVSQEHFEFVKVPGHELEKKTEMEVDPDTGELTVRRQVTEGDEIRKSVHKFAKEKTAGFVTEGTNMILQRLLIRCGFHEEINFITLDSDAGQMVQISYKPLPGRKQQVGKQELQVTGIERSIMSVTDLPYTWQSYFMEDGHLTMRVQVGSPAVVTLEKVPRLIERDEVEIKPVFGKQSLVWEEDMEMNSRFLQRKEELKAGHQMYLREHPDATALLADFFQFLLLRQPDDVVSFAADFFSTFSNSLPEISPYKHSETELPQNKQFTQ